MTEINVQFQGIHLLILSGWKQRLTVSKIAEQCQQTFALTELRPSLALRSAPRDIFRKAFFISWQCEKNFTCKLTCV